MEVSDAKGQFLASLAVFSDSKCNIYTQSLVNRIRVWHQLWYLQSTLS